MNDYTKMLAALCKWQVNAKDSRIVLKNLKLIQQCRILKVILRKGVFLTLICVQGFWKYSWTINKLVDSVRMTKLWVEAFWCPSKTLCCFWVFNTKIMTIRLCFYIRQWPTWSVLWSLFTPQRMMSLDPSQNHLALRSHWSAVMESWRLSRPTAPIGSIQVN